MSRRFLKVASLFFVASAACAVQPIQGGANSNDRTNGGDQGEALLTGAMVVSADGKFAVMQRNQTTVLLDIEHKTTALLPTQISRFVFAKTKSSGIAVLPNRAGVVAYDLPSLKEVWRVVPALSTDASLARLSDDDKNLVLGDVARVLVLNADTGDVRASVDVGSLPDDLSFVPTKNQALVVGTTQWSSDHKPSTAIVAIDLGTLASKRIEVPNCNAPLVVVPAASRAFLSPTFCEQNRSAQDKTQWTNPDPVSVIDLKSDGPAFVKNLPGFGPNAMSTDGGRIIAYVDVQRIDRAMFEDPAKIPASNGPRYHIMTIDPASLAYDLTPIGDVLPRFAMSRNGKSLLVDATVEQFRGQVSVKARLDGSGNVSVSASFFGQTQSLMGVFDLDAKKYTAIAGRAPLDRFVQLGDNNRVFTLVTSADGMGGDIWRIDVDTHRATSLGKNYRDIGVLADGKTMIVRERLPAVQVNTGSTVSWYRHERYCFTYDGVTCISEVQFQDATPFQTGPQCTDYHDC